MSAPGINIDVPRTLGALLIGAFFASMFSGVVHLQTLLYFRSYKADPLGFKSLVVAVWALDTLHTAFIWTGMWDYLIIFYGDDSKINSIPWCVSLTVVLTAMLTFLVHCFFAHRIWLLSKRNWVMVAPVFILALLRLGSATATTSQMFHYNAFDTFKLHARWIFTLGLSVSSAVDVLITALIFYLFHSTRPDAGHLKHVIDKLILYAFETGSLTCIGTILSLICWVVMSHNLIFLGLHFVIGKLYANSLLVTLNTRQNIRQSRAPATSVDRGPVIFVDSSSHHRSTKAAGPYGAHSTPAGDYHMDDYAGTSPKELQITVETTRSVQYEPASMYVSGKGRR
ncbi:hypothetical protein R3P38DRAFT_2819069 [Favolaschia claudopus]|uniref:DUF6534 domain-containing protein n=1 Tax=Favolaschia claudopus TaxID=2862362 RepID=A0AAW0EFT2_9AGAR